MKITVFNHLQISILLVYYHQSSRICVDMYTVSLQLQTSAKCYKYPELVKVEVLTLLKMACYYNTTMCHYWDMSVK